MRRACLGLGPHPQLNRCTVMNKLLLMKEISSVDGVGIMTVFVVVCQDVVLAARGRDRMERKPSHHGLPRKGTIH